MRFQAGSIGKLVLSVVVLALVDRHKLDLGQPIGRWLDEAPPDWRGITLHQLLTQTSGLGHWGDIPGLPSTWTTAPPAREELLAMLAEAPLVDEPGARWRYSGPGFLVAASVVESATGARYSTVATELVITPAGLTSTTSGHFPIGETNVATGHHKGEPIQVNEGFTRIPGTGDLWTTTDDLIRLSQALRTNTVLTQAAAARLWTSYTAVDKSGGPTGEPVVTEAYGYGTFLGQVKGQSARINPGDNPGYQSLLAYLPDSDTDIAVLCNEEMPSVNSALGSLTLGEKG